MRHLVVNIDELGYDGLLRVRVVVDGGVAGQHDLGVTTSDLIRIPHNSTPYL